MLRSKKENGFVGKIGTNGNHCSADRNDEKSQKTHRSVYLIFLSLLLDLLAFTIILPLLPTILERYRMNDSSGLYNYLALQIKYFQQLVGAPEKYSSVLFGGFLGSMFSFLQFIISPIMGGLSDYYGRKPIMLISLVNYLLQNLYRIFFMILILLFLGGNFIFICIVGNVIKFSDICNGTICWRTK